MRTVAVIGGGPAGMMAAISAAREGADVTLYEKNPKLGKKLFITGKGRCNLTNGCDVSEFFDNVVTNSKFLYSAIYSFTNVDTMAFFEGHGLKLKEERGQRIFPTSDRSSDVIKTLEKALKDAGVRVVLNREIKSVNELNEDAIIIATGGLSYQSTGSTGDGYVFAQAIGHEIVKPQPSLVPIRLKEPYVKQLEGLSLRNISIRITNWKGDELYSDFGEMLFTSRGVSGPVILSASSVAGRYINTKGDCTLHIDLKPALNEEQLDDRILRDFEGARNRDFRNSLDKLLPTKLIPVIVNLSGIDPFKKVNEITRQEREGLVKLLKDFCFEINKTEG
ncbi:MAG: aminoacetone oxidase family FAD-binding enzyme, partial [Lachnospiraceae bacterium]|nr:aminoacetone oxidase family FAD-binding enzyme [Lachnospiraceae bacterium]